MYKTIFFFFCAFCGSKINKMKSIVNLIIFAGMLSAHLFAQPLTHVTGLPDGFASLNGGVTGGVGGPVVTLTNEGKTSLKINR